MTILRHTTWLPSYRHTTFPTQISRKLLMHQKKSLRSAACRLHWLRLLKCIYQIIFFLNTIELPSHGRICGAATCVPAASATSMRSSWNAAMAAAPCTVAGRPALSFRSQEHKAPAWPMVAVVSSPQAIWMGAYCVGRRVVITALATAAIGPPSCPRGWLPAHAAGRRWPPRR